MNLALTSLTFSLFIMCAPYAQSSGTRSRVGESYAREQVQRTIKAANKAVFHDPLLPTKAVAIAVVEPLLFTRYGKENIMRQRPYEVYLVEGIWYLSGTLPHGQDGGTFELMVEASTSRVLALTYGK